MCACFSPCNVGGVLHVCSICERMCPRVISCAGWEWMLCNKEAIQFVDTPSARLLSKVARGGAGVLRSNTSTGLTIIFFSHLFVPAASISANCRQDPSLIRRRFVGSSRVLVLQYS